jgi:hypothetical protein
MPKPTRKRQFSVEVADVLHIRRTATVVIVANDEDDAEERAIEFASDNAHKIQWDEEQIDADPYEVSEVTEVFPHLPHSCPSNHWNRGDDICEDCGTNLQE